MGGGRVVPSAVVRLLGEPLVLVLRVLVGPLHGVCLRNLCWHGST